MPNISHNSIKISGTEERLRAFKDLLKEGVSFFECILPAPDNASREWYDEHWGVSQISDLQFADKEIEFNTAWAPPYEFLLRISKSYPEIVFQLHYFIIEMMWCGHVKIQDGVGSDIVYYMEDRVGMTATDIAYGRDIFGEIMEINESKNLTHTL